MHKWSAVITTICLCLVVGSYAATKARPTTTHVSPKSLTFTQDALHNCGTMAMLLSWAKTRPQDASSLVRRQANGAYSVSFRGVTPILVTPADLAAAKKARLVRTPPGDDWAAVVLTAFAKHRSGPGHLDFTVMEWIYAGEIAQLLTGSAAGNFDIKNESLDSNGRLQVGKPISLSKLRTMLESLRRKPVVAYTNRRVHIWAVYSYDPARSRVLVRNPRSRTSEWISLSHFIEKFQLLCYG